MPDFEDAYWLFALAGVAALAAVGAIFYFSTRAEPRRPPKIGQGVEPSFGGKKTEEPQQGTLEVDDFVPPELPSPPESLLPLEICYTARFYGDKPATSGDMESFRKQLHSSKNRNSYLLGFDESGGQWRMPPESPCRYWIVAVPLADRGGAIAAADIQRLEEQSRVFAQKKQMRVVFPSMSESLENAAVIDGFCAAADMFIEIRLSGESHPAARTDEILRLVGMSNDERGYVCRVNSENLFRARLMTATAGGRQTIIFEMDAPNISDPPRAFGEMIRAARRAAGMLNMKLTDPQGAPIDDARMAEMDKQLALLASQMRKFGAEPGSATARIIFS